MTATDYIMVDRTASTPLLLCPICGLEAVHPTVVECLSPGTAKGRVVITSDGLMVDPRSEPDGRGVRITLQFCCEAGHEFAYRLHFHKGCTTVQRLARLTARTGEPARTIWRD